MSCERDPALEAARRGYRDAGFVVPSALPAVDWALEPFDLIAAATTAAASASWTTVVSYTVPAGKYGRLTHWGQDADANGTYQTTQWRIVVNGGIRGNVYPALVAVCGITAANLCPFEVFLGEGDCVQLQALNSANPGEVVRGRLKGQVRGRGAVSK